jgi:signal transduction histidine kinase
VDVSACVAAAVQAASLPVGIAIELKALDDLPAVVAGQQSLTLIFANLMENAAEAMQGQGTLSIQGMTRDDRVEIAVHDSGPGIAPEWHDRIFEFNFSQGVPAPGAGPAHDAGLGTNGRKPFDNGRSARARGKLGFGLWWVKTLMVRLGGSVAVESDGQAGTTFRLTLPQVEAGL